MAVHTTRGCARIRAQCERPLTPNPFETVLECDKQTDRHREKSYDGTCILQSGTNDDDDGSRTEVQQ